MKTIAITPVCETSVEQTQHESNSTCSSSALVALQVLDASMAPELCAGQIVIIDRTGKLIDGSMVLVETDDQLLIRFMRPVDEDYVDLLPLNPLWKVQRLAKKTVQLKGVVSQRTGHRRRDRKRYA